MGAMAEKELVTLSEHAKAYRASPLHIVSGATLSIHELISIMRKHVYSNGVKAIFVDYMQLIRHGGSSKLAHWEKIADISSELKAASLSLNVPIVAASQLSKDAILGGGTYNQAGSFRLAMDCDFSAELRRRSNKELEKDASGSHVLDVQLNRHGLADLSIKLLFCGESMRMEEI